MTKSELIEDDCCQAEPAVREGCRVGGEDCSRAYVPGTVQGERIEIRGFGSFSLHFRAAPSWREPEDR